MLLFLVFTNFSCKKLKEEPTLPPATQTGENKMGCLIDGEVWEPHKFPAGYPLSASYPFNETGQMKILGRNTKKAVGDILIRICKDSLLSGRSSFGFYDDSRECSAAVYIVDGSNNDYESIPGGAGEVIITRFDTIEKIVSGTFYFDAYEVDYHEGGYSLTGNMLEIRDGRFDIEYEE
jgi:hypothetical protein